MFISVYLSVSSRFLFGRKFRVLSVGRLWFYLLAERDRMTFSRALAVLLSSRIPWVDNKKIVCFLCSRRKKKMLWLWTFSVFIGAKMSLIDSRHYLHTYWVPSIFFISGENDFIRLFHIHAQALSASLLPYSLQIPYTIVCDASSNVRYVDRSESAPLADRVEINKALDHWSKPRYLQCTSSKNKFFIFLFFI